jgi:iron complex transport system substrate-binding protein
MAAIVAYPCRVRIVSLLPSATETVAALGLAGSLVGRSHECDFPVGIEYLPVVSLARIGGGDLAAAEVDAAVRDALARGDELYAVDADVLGAVRPDVIVTQTLCTVCAVSGDGVRRTARAVGVDAEVIELEPTTVDGVLAAIAELGRRLGAEARAGELVAESRERLAAVGGAVAGRQRPAVFVAEWLDPPFAAGHWVPELVELAGGREVLGHAGQPSFTTTWDAVAAAAPDVCVVAPCGYDTARAAAEARTSPAATCAPSVVAVDASAYLSRPGPRIVDGAELLAAILHPDAVPPFPRPDAWAVVGTPGRIV